MSIALILHRLVAVLRDTRPRATRPSIARRALLAPVVLVSTLLVLITALVLVVLARPIVRLVLVPLGWPRAAHYLTTLTDGDDRHGRAVLAAARALLRMRRPADALAWLDTRLRAVPHVDGAVLLAAGLRAHASGDLERARELVTSLDELAPGVCRSSVRQLARSWRIADAASRGQWRQVIELDALGAGTRASRLQVAVAHALLATSAAPSALQLWTSWLLAPARRRTLPLVRQVLAGARLTPDAAPPAGDRGPVTEPRYDDALAAHVAAIADPGQVDAVHLADLAATWDLVLADPAIREELLRRAAALGADGADRTIDTLRRTVATDIAELALAAKLPLAELSVSSAVLRDAAALLRERLMSELELAFDAIAARVSARRALPALEEWREWLAVRALHAHVASLGGLELRRLAFPHVHDTMCELAVWLWNEREERVIANAMFQWLYGEASEVGDAEAIELQSKNASLRV